LFFNWPKPESLIFFSLMLRHLAKIYHLPLAHSKFARTFVEPKRKWHGGKQPIRGISSVG
jgi:hypothetical protein